VFESAKRPQGLVPLMAVIFLQLVPLMAWVVPIDVRAPTQPTSSPGTTAGALVSTSGSR